MRSRSQLVSRLQTLVLYGICGSPAASPKSTATGYRNLLHKLLTAFGFVSHTRNLAQPSIWDNAPIPFQARAVVWPGVGLLYVPQQSSGPLCRAGPEAPMMAAVKTTLGPGNPSEGALKYMKKSPRPLHFRDRPVGLFGSRPQHMVGKRVHTNAPNPQEVSSPMRTNESAFRARLVRVGFFLGLVALLTAAVLLVACGGGSSAGGNVTPPSGAPNQLGTAGSTSVSCPPSNTIPPVAGSACFILSVSCPSVAQYNTVELKVTQPSGPSIGTVIYTTGGGGNQLYEDQFVYGNVAVNNVVAAGYTAVQTNFNSGTGWLDGPGGPLLLSCRWATTAQWVHDNVRVGSTPYCATGNSGGAGVIAYALARFGQDSIFTFVLPTSGPPFTRIDYGCRCSQQTMQTTKCAGVQGTCYGTDANMFLDPAYGNTTCSNPSAAPSTAQWQADSILSSDGKSQLSYKTPVEFIFGALDMGSGSALAVLWENAITSSSSDKCVADGPHKIPDVLDGAQLIASELVANCH